MQLRILAISTTSKYPSVSYKSPDNTVISREVQNKFDHMKNLIPMVNEVLPSPRAVDLIAVDIGPGSFVGTRIGVSTARALSQMLDVPVIPIESLASLAYVDGLEADLICPMIDARNDTAYAACYSFIDSKLVTVMERDQYNIKEFILKMSEHIKKQSLLQESFRGGEVQGKIHAIPAGFKKVIFMGDAAQKNKARIEDMSDEFSVLPMRKVLNEPNSIRILRVACALAEAKGKNGLLKAGIAVRHSDVIPIYSRIAEAEKSLIKRGGRKIYIAPEVKADQSEVLSLEGEFFGDEQCGNSTGLNDLSDNFIGRNIYYISNVFTKGYSRQGLEKDMRDYLERLKTAASGKALRFTLVMKEERSFAVDIGEEEGKRAELIGFITLTLVAADAEVERICIAKNRQNLGLGKMILTAAMDVLRFLGAESVFLEVRAGNVYANKLYASNGFINTGRRKAYYKDGEDCLLLKKDIGSSK